MVLHSQNTFYGPSLEEDFALPNEEKLLKETLSMKPIDSRTYYSGFFVFQSDYGNNMDALWDKSIKVDVWSNGVIRINNKEYYGINKSNNVFYRIGEGPFTCYKIQFPHYPQRDEINLISFGKEHNFLYMENYNIKYQRLAKSQTGIPSYDNGISNSNGSVNTHSSNGTSCNSCGGTGYCKACSGKGEYWIETGTFTGKDTNKLIKCPVCRGTKHCGVCRGLGRIN